MHLKVPLVEQKLIKLLKKQKQVTIYTVYQNHFYSKKLKTSSMKDIKPLLFSFSASSLSSYFCSFVFLFDDELLPAFSSLLSFTTTNNLFD